MAPKLDWAEKKANKLVDEYIEWRDFRVDRPHYSLRLAVAHALRAAYKAGYKACEIEWKCACRRNCNRAIEEARRGR